MIYLFWKVHFFKFCRKIPPQRRPRICRPVPAQADRLPVRRLWHAIATRLPHPPRTRASSAQPCGTLPGCSTNPRFFGPSLNSMQKPPPATFCPPPVCACCRMRSRLTACCFHTHPTPLRLWASSASPCSTLSDRWTNPGVFGLFVDRMHKQPHATFCTPFACAFCRVRTRPTACCLYTHPAPPRLWASSASPCSTLSDRWTNPGVFGLFVDRMHKQPHATFCTPSACAFGRTQPRVPPYCFYARSTPPRMRASLALHCNCSFLPDRRHASVFPPLELCNSKN